MSKQVKKARIENAKKKVNTSEGDGLNALIFIDTNVLLDFYRNRNDDVRMMLLDEI